MVVVDRAAHMLTVEQPDATSMAMRQWLAEEQLAAAAWTPPRQARPAGARRASGGRLPPPSREVPVARRPPPVSRRRSVAASAAGGQLMAQGSDQRRGNHLRGSSGLEVEHRGLNRPELALDPGRRPENRRSIRIGPHLRDAVLEHPLKVRPADPGMPEVADVEGGLLAKGLPLHAGAVRGFQLEPDEVVA